MNLIRKFMSRISYCPKCGSTSIRRTAKKKVVCKGCHTRFNIICTKLYIEMVEENGWICCGMRIYFLKSLKKHNPEKQRFP